MPTRSFSLGKLIGREKETDDLLVDVAFASDAPYERWWGIEILDMGEKSVRLDRLKAGAPLLFNHNWDDIRGTHEPDSIRIDKDKVLRGRVRITSATQTGRDTAKMVQTNILTKASVGYKVHRVIEQSTGKSGEPIERELSGNIFEHVLDRTHRDHGGDRAAFMRSLDIAAGIFERADGVISVFRVIDWEPHENSLVTVPADNGVGVGRSAIVINPDDVIVVKPATTADRREAMTDKVDAAAGASADEKKVAERESAEREAREKLDARSALDLEQGRVRAIENLAKANKIADNIRDAWVRQGYSLEQVSNDILTILEERGKSNPQPASRLGLTGAETQRFSIARAIEAAASGKWDKAGFELEASRAVAQKLGKVADEKRFFVPFEVQTRPFATDVVRMLESIGRRDLTVAAAGAGGYLVGTENQGFIEILRNRSVVFRMGARRLPGLQGSVTVPRQSAAATAYWLATEATAITESQQTFVQMALSPKTVGAYTEISRQLLLQSSPAAEAIVNDDLAQVVAIAADLGALEGSGGSGQPTGISGTAGIGSVTGTSLAASGVIEFQTDVASSNVMPQRGGYVTTPAVAGLLMARPELPTTGTERLWKGNIWDGSLFNFPAMTSNQLTAASMIFGDWQELVIGEWGVLEVEVNPYANFQAGIIGVRAMYSLDVGVRRPFAFSRATSIT